MCASTVELRWLLLAGASSAAASGAAGSRSLARRSDSDLRRLVNSTPWGGSVCGAGRRRRTGGPPICECVASDGTSCLEYYDNCCELGQPDCCAADCAGMDLACLPSTGTSTTTCSTTTSTTDAATWRGLCPWVLSSGSPDQFECNDGVLCSAENCCAARGGRRRCPAGLTMCSSKDCGVDDFCCKATCEAPRGPRPCLEHVEISAGNSHSLFVRLDGAALATGFNNDGQLGDGTGWQRATPGEVPIGEVQSVSSSDHSLFLKLDGTAWASGPNDYGQLGDGTRAKKLSPVQVMTGVAAVSAGPFHSVFLKQDGTAWATGKNTYGQLGDNTTVDRLTPVLILQNVRAISAGSGHTLLLCDDGTAWATGWNLYGQLGDGTGVTRHAPVPVLGGVRSVAAGGQHSVFVLADGGAWAAGYNNAGQLGDGSHLDRLAPVQVLTSVAAADAGVLHTLFLRSDQTAWGAGHNADRQLGDGTTVSRSTPLRVLENVLAVSAGDRHSLFMSRSGTVWAVGWNTFGQLGDGTQSDVQVPTEILNVWPLPTSTTTVSATSTTTRTATFGAAETCAPNAFPSSSSFSAENLPRWGDLFSASLLYPVFRHEQWRLNETWTLSFRVTSGDAEPRLFGFVGGAWFLVFTVPPGVVHEHMYVSGGLAYAGAEARVEFLGAGRVGNVTFSDVYLAPGVCTRPLDYQALRFAYDVGAWGSCPVPCGGSGLQTRSVACRGSDGKVYFDGWACTEPVPVDRMNCTGTCPAAAGGPLQVNPAWIVLAVVLPCVVMAIMLCLCHFWRGRQKLSAVQPAVAEVGCKPEGPAAGCGTPVEASTPLSSADPSEPGHPLSRFGSFQAPAQVGPPRKSARAVAAWLVPPAETRRTRGKRDRKNFFGAGGQPELNGCAGTGEEE